MSEQTSSLAPNFVTVAGIELYENPDVLGDQSIGDEQSKRFIIDDEPYIRNAYSFVVAQLSQEMAQDASIVGATSFGSTTKGYARAGESDVDLTVFIDTDSLGLAQRSNITADDVIWNPWYACEGREAKKISDSYDEKLKSSLAPQPQDELKLEVSPEAYPISHELLRTLAGFELAKAATHAHYKQLLAETPRTPIDDMADWDTVSTDTESLRAIPSLAEALYEDPETDDYFDIMSVIEFLGRIAAKEDTELAQLRPTMLASNRHGSSLPLRLFGLAITPNLLPYRQTFLRELAKSPDPDQAWNYFSTRLKKFENSDKHPRDVNLLHYPETMDDAMRLYS